MLIRTLIDTIRKLIDTISKAIASLLLVFWLWIPALFCLTYFFACLFFGLNFVQYRSYFWVGLAISGGVSVVCIMRRGLGKSLLGTRLPRVQGGQVPMMQAPMLQAPIYNGQQMYPYPMLPQYPYSPTVNSYPNVSNLPVDNQSKQLGSNPSGNINKVLNEPIGTGGKEYDYDEHAATNTQVIQSNVAYPLVFASRKNPNIFVHEYSDRLIFYYNEGKKFVNLGTEFKDSSYA